MVYTQLILYFFILYFFILPFIYFLFCIFLIPVFFTLNIVNIVNIVIQIPPIQVVCSIPLHIPLSISSLPLFMSLHILHVTNKEFLNLESRVVRVKGFTACLRP